MIKLTKFNSQTNKKGEFVLNAEIDKSSSIGIIF